MGKLKNEKKLLICFFIAHTLCFSEQPEMNPILSNAMNSYFTDLIPKYYQGKSDLDEDRFLMSMKNNFYMTGSGMHMFMDSDALIFNFYYLIEHDKQSIQVINVATKIYNNFVYEYWSVGMSDKGYPYNYSFFYLTKTDSLTSGRIVLDISKHYKNTYKLDDGYEIDLTIDNLKILYQIEPWLSLESFKNTIYEKKILFAYESPNQVSNDIAVANSSQIPKQKLATVFGQKVLIKMTKVYHAASIKVL